MVIDNHVHIGWFRDGYHSPKDVWNSLLAAGIDGVGVSSTTTCTELYKNVVREMREFSRIGGDKVHPILWLTPRMLKYKYPLPYMLHSRIRWDAVKIHSESHPEWVHNSMLLSAAVDVARQLAVPMVIHTGNKECCHAGIFKSIIEHNKDVTFVLAHGRPLNETIDIMSTCPNTYVDTAFMPTSDIKIFINEGFAERILFGTDAPINEAYFKNTSTTDYVARTILELYDSFGKETDRILSRCIYGQ